MSYVKVCFTFIIMCLSMMSYSNDGKYEEIEKSFADKHINVWAKQNLIDEINKIECGSIYLVTSDSWSKNHSFIMYSGSETKGVCILDEFGKLKEMEYSDFVNSCNAPVLMYYNSKCYINIPKDECKYDSSKTVGEMYFGDLYKVILNLTKQVLTKNLKAYIQIADGRVFVKKCKFTDKITNEEMQNVLVNREWSKQYKKWKCAHDKLVAKLPRKKPVVFGTSSKIVRRMDGVFEIPYEKPATSKITYKDKVVYGNRNGGVTYSDDYGNVVYGKYNERVPVGVVTEKREKPISQIYDYDELLEKMQEYEELEAKIKEDKEPIIDVNKILPLFNNTKLQIILTK